MQKLIYFKLHLLFVLILLMDKISSISAERTDTQVPQILNRDDCESGYFEMIFHSNHCYFTDKSHNNVFAYINYCCC